MRKVRDVEMEKLACLFEETEETMIWSCLEGIMGNAWCNDVGSAAQIITADFCAFAGDARAAGAKELVRHIPEDFNKKFILMVPQDEIWAGLIEETYGEQAHAFTRYAFKKEKDIFDEEYLKHLVQKLPKEYSLVPIDEKRYKQCMAEEWSKDLCAQFASWKDYERSGIGFLVLDGEQPVCGASSYTIYSQGIEIEIDTKEAYRRRGLATVCGAKLILECLKKGLYPSWDAANLYSVGLAEKLGYHLSHDYKAYEVTLE